MLENKNVLKKYNLPTEIKFCKKCVMSNQRPRIVFDEEGVCSACRFSEHKHNGINWAAREELKERDKHGKMTGLRCNRAR